MQQRLQHTIAQPAEVVGVGIFSGADVTVRFLPAPPNTGILFQRVDCSGNNIIPARIEYAVPRRRRTALSNGHVTVEMTEHILASLVGLQVDNCLVELNSHELPGGDGSALPYAEAILDAGVIAQEAIQPCLLVEHPVDFQSDDQVTQQSACSLKRNTYAISYHLDYGQRSPIRPQNLTVEITPETFMRDLAFARTFVLESEVEALRAQGFGLRMTEKDLLVFSDDGQIVGNQLRANDECVRHKILDCLGDYALIGCDLSGHFSAFRSGHVLNREMVRRLMIAHADQFSGRIENLQSEIKQPFPTISYNNSQQASPTSQDDRLAA